MGSTGPHMPHKKGVNVPLVDSKSDKLLLMRLVQDENSSQWRLPSQQNYALIWAPGVYLYSEKWQDMRAKIWTTI